MIHRINFSVFLLICFSLALLNTGILNSVYAAQQSNNKSLQNEPGKLSGKVIEVIPAASFIYVEIDTGTNKAWAAGSSSIVIKKGDTIAFTTESPMYNFHSKTLNRNFSTIYFIKKFITGKEAKSISTLPVQSKNQSLIKPYAAKFAKKPGQVKVGGYLRETTLNGLNVSNKKFSDYKGKPLIINVWASWCGPCRAEMDSLEQLSKRYNGKQFNIIGISTDDYRDRAETLIRQTSITFDNFLDSRLVLEKMLGANTIPLTILVDKQGRVLNKIRGAREWDSPKMIESIGKTFNIKLVP